MSKAKFINELKTPGEPLEFRMDLPEDLHWRELWEYPYKGEIYNTTEDKYYSRKCGQKYRDNSIKRKANDPEKHLDEGHFQGFSFGIDHYSKPGDLVVDPFVGSGTTLIEAHLKNRDAIGIELEYSKVLNDNIEYLKNRFPSDSKLEVLIGDAREKVKEINRPIDLIITGFPYPIISGNITADAPLRPLADKKGLGNKSYLNSKSIGVIKYGPEYLDSMNDILAESASTLKIGGYLITIIKDCIRSKKPFFLQKYVVEHFLEKNPEFEIDSWFVHRHIPTTMFMNTYPKNNPDVPFPMYQIGLALKKTKLSSKELCADLL